MAMQTPIHGSEAYDLSLFEERPARQLKVVKPTKKAIKEQRRHQRMQSVINVAVTMLVVTAICAVVGLMIFNRVQITETNDLIIQKQEDLKILQSENIRLSNELASQISAEQVDAYAAANGMKKIDSYQLRYITGIEPENGCAIVDKTGVTLYTDMRYMEAAEKLLAGTKITPVLYKRDEILKRLASYESVGISFDQTAYVEYLALEKAGV